MRRQRLATDRVLGLAGCVACRPGADEGVRSGNSWPKDAGSTPAGTPADLGPSRSHRGGREAMYRGGFQTGRSALLGSLMLFSYHWREAELSHDPNSWSRPTICSVWPHASQGCHRWKSFSLIWSICGPGTTKLDPSLNCPRLCRPGRYPARHRAMLDGPALQAYRAMPCNICCLPESASGCKNSSATMAICWCKKAILRRAGLGKECADWPGLEGYRSVQIALDRQVFYPSWPPTPNLGGLRALVRLRSWSADRRAVV